MARKCDMGKRKRVGLTARATIHHPSRLRGLRMSGQMVGRRGDGQPRGRGRGEGKT